MAKEPTPKIAVIGAGVSGILAAAYLKAAGLETIVFERSSQSGGVW
jgi:MFS transporter, ACS family, pantothenate transporter